MNNNYNYEYSTSRGSVGRHLIHGKLFPVYNSGGPITADFSSIERAFGRRVMGGAWIKQVAQEVIHIPFPPAESHVARHKKKTNMYCSVPPKAR